MSDPLLISDDPVRLRTLLLGAFNDIVELKAQHTALRARLGALEKKWRAKTGHYSVWDDAADELAARLQETPNTHTEEPSP